MEKYADLFEMPEDMRIEAIGEAAAVGLTIGVVLEKKETAKIARYIRKVTSRYPTVAVLARIDGPTPLVITIKFGPKPN